MYTLYFDSGSKKRRNGASFPLLSRFLFLRFVFVCFFLFLLSAFLVLFLFFWFIRIFFPSAFYYPHFSIRIRHPQVSGPRFTDTFFNDSQNSRAAEPPCNERNMQPYEI